MVFHTQRFISSLPHARTQKKGGSCVDELNRPGVCVGFVVGMHRGQSCGRQLVGTPKRFRSRWRRSSVARSRAGLCFRGSGVMIRRARPSG